jgi:archaellum component FlaF (FlaF/FlaG flagellin family)
MGFSLIATAAILGIALFMAVEIIASDFLPTMEDVNTSYGAFKDRIQQQLQTDITITMVVQTDNGTDYDYNISVHNTGSVTLATHNFMVLINGSECPFTCSHQYLYPENTVYFEVINQPGGGQERVKVTTNNGIAAYYTYGE